MTRRPLYLLLFCLLMTGLVHEWIRPAATQELRIASGPSPESWGNPYRSTSITTYAFYSALFDPLVLVTSEGDLEPWLAVDWLQIGQNEWEFTLRDGIRFSNGEPLTAEAISVALQYLASNRGQSEPVGRELSNVNKVTVTGPLTFHITTERPDPLLPRKLSLLRVPAPKAWQESGPDEFARTPIGTGPFILGENEQTHAALEINPTSWRRPKISALRFLKISDANARRTALLTGVADISLGGAISLDLVEDVKELGFQIQVSHVPAVVAMVFNAVDDARFKNKKLRKALSLAIDREAILRFFVGAESAVANQSARRNAFGYNPNIPETNYDPERARVLLTEAGYPDGLSLVLEMPGGTVIYVNVFQKIAADLARIGVEMEVRVVPPVQFLSNIQTGDWAGSAMAIPFYSPVNDALYPMRQHSCLWPAPWYCDDQTTALIQSALNEPDLSSRRSKTQAVMARASEEAQALFLYETIQFFALAPYVNNFRSDLGFVRFENIELAR